MRNVIELTFVASTTLAESAPATTKRMRPRRAVCLAAAVTYRA
jgi:hypothetical protein